MAETAGGRGSNVESPVVTGEGNQIDPALLKRKSNDNGWQWGRLVDPRDKNKLKCLLCGHESSGGINRLKQHLAWEGTSVIHCPKVTPDVKQKCEEDLDRPKRKKREKQQAEADLRDDVVITGTREGSEVESRTPSSNGSASQKLGPMDRWTRPIDPKATKEEAKRQQSLNEALWKERTYQVQQYIARWVYTHGIPFNALDNDEFIEMVEAIGCFGPGCRPPSQDDLREKLLEEEHARMQSLLQDHEEAKKKNGCSVMTDGWTDMKRRSIMNVCTHTFAGSSFMKSKEMSDVSHILYHVLL